MSAAINPMSQLRISKVCVNIGVGEGGERLVNAENVLELVTGVKPQRTLGRIQNRDLKVRIGAPIGCKATMRNKDAIHTFLTSAFDCRENIIPAWNFDREGNLSFGVRDYTDFPGQKYDPDIGIFGMDITVVWSDQATVSVAADEPRARSVRATVCRQMNPEHGSLRISTSKSWRNEDGKRSRRENWTNHWMPSMRTQARPHSTPRAAIVPTMLPRRRT